MAKQFPVLSIDESLLHPGQRVGVALSGGADSVALLLALLQRRESRGLVLSVVHVHHGIRGEDADRDQRFVEALAAENGLIVHLSRVDTPGYAARAGESLEEAARTLRYKFFRSLMQEGLVDAVATAHTLDDQAETVLQKMLRGGWTEGLGGISPVVHWADGKVLRPLLVAARSHVEVYLNELSQRWREDETNRLLQYTRNRVRHELLPVLRTFNPRIVNQLSHMAAIARDEEAYWLRELARIGPGMVMPGKPVRGGGRASSTHPEEASIALELERLRPLGPAMQRRLLRWAALQVKCPLDFDQTERLMQLCNFGGIQGAAARRMELAAGLSAHRTAREIQLVRRAQRQPAATRQEWNLPVPGKVRVPELGLVLTAHVKENGIEVQPALLRFVRAGDRATPRYSSGPKKIKDMLERLHIPAAERQLCPVLVWPGESGQIIWLREVELDPASLPQMPFVLEVEQLKADLK